jgi:ribosomal protein S18 acetylase RimI-like enzyme
MPHHPHEIGPATGDEVAQGLDLAWRHLAQPQRAQQITRTLAAWVEGPDPTATLLVARGGGEVVGAAWAQLQPGRTVIIAPPHLAAGQSPTTADRLLEELLRVAIERGARMAQAMLVVDHGDDFDRLVAHGFEHVADLLYMVSLAAAFPDQPPATPLEFETYTEDQAARLARLIERSYEGTLDCPRLNGLREIGDVVAGYRAAGSFDPARWFLLRHAGLDVGCLLLTDHPEHRQWELVYLALAPEYRGRGWGIEAVRRAQFLTGQAHAKCLLLAVDADNRPAITMYSQAGFTAWDRRSVLVRTLDR